MSFVLFLVGLSLVILAHESGHFIAAKLCGMKVLRFSLGFGPILVSRKVSGTSFELRLIPFGGFIQPLNSENDLKGLKGFSGDELEMLRSDTGAWMSNRGGLEHALLALAGPVASIVFGLVVMVALACFVGQVQVAKPVTIDKVLPGSIAEKRGVKLGDRLLEVNKMPAEDDLSWIANKANAREFLIEGERGRYAVRVPEDEALGVMFRPVVVKLPMLQGMRVAAEDTLLLVSLNAKAFLHLARGVGLDQVTGPIGIAKIGTESAAGGLAAFLSFVAALTIALGVFNLLPIPILDGGQVVMGLCKAAGLRLPEKTQIAVQISGLLLLLLILVAATLKDVWVLFAR